MSHEKINILFYLPFVSFTCTLQMFTLQKVNCKLITCIVKCLLLTYFL